MTNIIVNYLPPLLCGGFGSYFIYMGFRMLANSDYRKQTARMWFKAKTAQEQAYSERAVQLLSGPLYVAIGAALLIVASSVLFGFDLPF